MEEAERRLREARARVRDLSSAIAAGRGFGDWDELRAAQEDVLAEEREVSRASGDEYAVELDLGLAWSTGAPRPHLLANGREAYVLFYLTNPDPDRDSTWVRIVDPGPWVPRTPAAVPA
jgi:hypothetical protein